MRENKKHEKLKDDTLRLTLADRTIVIARSRVQWVHAQGDYMRLHTDKGSYLARISLRVLEERWGKYGFVRIHRSYMVFFPLVTDVRKGPSGYTVRVGAGPDAVDLPGSRPRIRRLWTRWIHMLETREIERAKRLSSHHTIWLGWEDGTGSVEAA
jgi:two-component system, LytTR family, response regulator LytT